MLGDNICLSGGAEGADLQFGMCAGKLGHTVIHWSFRGHKTQAPGEEVIELTDEQLAEVLPMLRRANKGVGRKVPRPGTYVYNLLARNWYQVRDAERVYAVSHFDDEGKVAGGTCWATQMFIDRHSGAACECYVFDQDQEQWFVWGGARGWITTDNVPQPYGVWAGIGSRKLKNSGKGAIRKLMGYVKERDRPGRLRIAPIFPALHITGEQIEQFHDALAKHGVRSDQYTIEGQIVFDAEIEEQVTEASYDIEDEA